MVWCAVWCVCVCACICACAMHAIRTHLLQASKYFLHSSSMCTRAHRTLLLCRKRPLCLCAERIGEQGKGQGFAGKLFVFLTNFNQRTRDHATFFLFISLLPLHKHDETWILGHSWGMLLHHVSDHVTSFCSLQPLFECCWNTPRLLMKRIVTPLQEVRFLQLMDCTLIHSPYRGTQLGCKQLAEC